MESVLRSRTGSDAGRAEELRDIVWNDPASVESLRVKRPCPTSWTLVEGELASSRAMLITEFTAEFGAEPVGDWWSMAMGDMRGISGRGELAMVANGRL